MRYLKIDQDVAAEKMIELWNEREKDLEKA